MEHILFAFLLLLLVFLILKFSSIGSRDKHLPPGPPTRWFLGNAHIFPRSSPHLTFTEWAKEYGDVMSLQIFHKTLIILNTPTAIKELIDKRSLACSNRPHTIIGKQLIPNDANFGMSQFADEQWKALRKAASGLLQSDNFRRYTDIQVAESQQLLWDFYSEPEEWFEHIHRYVVSFASIIIYGRRSPRLTSPDVADFLRVHPQFMDAMNIATVVPVDVFPILQWVPARWQQQVKDVKEMHVSLYGRLLDAVQKRMDAGNLNGCFMEDVIARQEELGINTRELLLNLGAVLLQGSDTSSAALHNIIFCLICYPDAQKKAFEEIDNVIGSSRSPQADDLPNLPYVKAFIEECNRLRPVDPLALPHSMDRDEIIDGLLYPKDATIFMNIWAIMHDERYFEDPDDFKPERFLQHPLGVRSGVHDDPARRPNLMFGGGRRVCPGINFAQSSFGIITASLIWAFRFLPHKDEFGTEIFPNMSNYTTGITANPIKTKIRIEPRSQQRIEILQRSLGEAAQIFGPFEQDLTPDESEYVLKQRSYLQI